MRTIAIIGTAVLALAATAARANPLGGYLGRFRPVLVFAPASSDLYNRQMRAFAATPGQLSDRDIAVIGIGGDNVTPLRNGPAVGASANAFRTAYGVPKDEFQVVLVGKDGGVKLRSRTPLEPGEIFRLVDGMPMRKQEMRRR